MESLANITVFLFLCVCMPHKMSYTVLLKGNVALAHDFLLTRKSFVSPAGVHLFLYNRSCNRHICTALAIVHICTNKSSLSWLSSSFQVSLSCLYCMLETKLMTFEILTNSRNNDILDLAAFACDATKGNMIMNMIETKECTIHRWA